MNFYKLFQEHYMYEISSFYIFFFSGHILSCWLFRTCWINKISNYWCSLVDFSFGLYGSISQFVLQPQNRIIGTAYCICYQILLDNCPNDYVPTLCPFPVKILVCIFCTLISMTRIKWHETSKHLFLWWNTNKIPGGEFENLTDKRIEPFLQLFSQ